MHSNITAIPAAQVVEMESAGSSVALGDQGETVEVWEYFAENINDFATAKTIVDHFAENPRLLESAEYDHHGLFVRAKLTIKRQQIAYAQAQAAITTARAQSRSVRGVVKSFVDFISALRSAIAENPTPVLIGLGVAVSMWFR